MRSEKGQRVQTALWPVCVHERRPPRPYIYRACSESNDSLLFRAGASPNEDRRKLATLHLPRPIPTGPPSPRVVSPTGYVRCVPRRAPLVHRHPHRAARSSTISRSRNIGFRLRRNRRAASRCETYGFDISKPPDIFGIRSPLRSISEKRTRIREGRNFARNTYI